MNAPRLLHPTCIACDRPSLPVPAGLPASLFGLCAEHQALIADGDMDSALLAELRARTRTQLPYYVIQAPTPIRPLALPKRLAWSTLVLSMLGSLVLLIVAVSALWAAYIIASAH